MDQRTITYRVDDADRIVSVSAGWDAFATENDGAAARSDRVLGHDLFDFIVDPVTQKLYRQMLARIRSGNGLRYTFRCDSPDCRRLMEMDVRAADGRGSVEFRSTILEAHPRPPLQLSRPDGASAAETTAMQRACGWCNRLMVDGAWLEIEDALPKLRLMERPSPLRLSHGICDDCMERMIAELASPTLAGQPRASDPTAVRRSSTE